MQEESIFDAAISEKETVTHLFVANREEQIREMKREESLPVVASEIQNKSYTPIASVQKEQEPTMMGEFDPYSFVVLVI